MAWLDPPNRYPFHVVDATAKMAMAAAGHTSRAHARRSLDGRAGFPDGMGLGGEDTTRGRYAGARRSVNLHRAGLRIPRYTVAFVATAAFTVHPPAHPPECS